MGRCRMGRGGEGSARKARSQPMGSSSSTIPAKQTPTRLGRPRGNVLCRNQRACWRISLASRRQVLKTTRHRDPTGDGTILLVHSDNSVFLRFGPSGPERKWRYRQGGSLPVCLSFHRRTERWENVRPISTSNPKSLGRCAAQALPRDFPGGSASTQHTSHKQESTPWKGRGLASI